jgi:PAS domain S-box-containing protein
MAGKGSHRDVTDRRIKVLIVDEHPHDVELIGKYLTKAGFEFTARRVDTNEELVRELQDFTPDLILSDYFLEQFDGMTALSLCKELAPASPFILVTGSISEEAAVECIKAGADDYVIKGHLARLEPAIIDAFRRKKIAQEKEKAEAALRESEEMFRLITESMSDLVAVLDLNGRRLYNSPSYRDLLGDPNDLRGTDSFAEIHPDDREYIKRIFDETTRTGVGQRAEYRLMVTDGTIRYIESVGGVMRGKEGKPERVVVVSRDVTERKEREEELKVQKAYFQQLFDTAPEGIVVRDEGGRVLQVNDEFLEMFGYTKEEVLGRLITDLIVPPGYPDLALSITKRASPGERVNLETRRRRKNGRLIDVSILATPIEVDGGRIAVYGMYRDITRQKRAEVERENLIRKLQDALSEVKLLSGLLPICSWCKKIRDDQGYYHQIEEYITSHSEAEFTHGICPECAAKHFSRNSTALT